MVRESCFIPCSPVQSREDLLTWWRAGSSVEGRTGAGDVTGTAGLSLVEGPFQLSPPLDPAVLLTEVLEDLLCRDQPEKASQNNSIYMCVV